MTAIYTTVTVWSSLTPATHAVQYNYTSNILHNYIDLSSLQSSWNCTVYDEDDQCYQEWPWVIKETCLIAMVGSNNNLAFNSIVLDNQKYFTHIAVDLTLQVGVLILGYVFSGLSLLIFIISMVFCCLGYKLCDLNLTAGFFF